MKKEFLASEIIERNCLSISSRLLLEQYYRILSIFDFNDNKNQGIKK